MKENEKMWVEPELIVLVRSKPEEVILANCKGIAAPGGVDTNVDQCMLTGACGLPCVDLGPS